MSRWMAGLVSAVACSACFTYTPVDQAPLGETVRVRIPIPSAVPGRAPESVDLEGLVLRTGDSISLSTETRREFGAYRELIQRDTVILAVSRLSSVEVKEFSQGKSIALGVGIAAVVTWAAAVAFGLGGGAAGEESPGPTGPVASVVTQPSLTSTVLGSFPLRRLLAGLQIR